MFLLSLLFYFSSVSSNCPSESKSNTVPHSEQTEKEGRVKVAIRVRPIIQQEEVNNEPVIISVNPTKNQVSPSRPHFDPSRDIRPFRGTYSSAVR